MPRWLEFLFANPLILFVLVAWIAGLLGNLLKARRKLRDMQKARERARSGTLSQPERQSPTWPEPAAERRQREPASVRPAEPQPAPAPARRSDEEIAREMRRILGLEPDPAPPTPPPVRPVPVPTSRPGEFAERSGAQRAPTPLGPPQRRPLPMRVDPHVGESVHARMLRTQAPPRQLGALGGRTLRGPRAAAGRRRFALDDVGRALVLAEILSPPLALRPFEERRSS